MSRVRVYRKFSEAFREAAVGRLRESDNVLALCRDLGISRQLLYQWRDRLERERGNLERDVEVERQLRQENAKLKQMLGEKALQLDFLQGALKKVEALRQSGAVSGGTASTRRFAK